MRTMRSSRDLEKKDILWILERAKEIEGGDGKSLQGRILGVLTFRPSLRTTASMMHSILKAGGSYIPLDASYVKSGEEDMEDTAKSVSDLVDVLAVRTPMDVEIKDLEAEVPMINLMCGDEHTMGALWFFYSLMKRGKNPEGMKIGIYGQVRYSQPTIAICRAGAKLGMQFFEDPVVKEIGSGEEFREEIERLGGTITQKPLEEFMGNVDMMWISEGRPGEGADQKILVKYLDRYRQITEDDFVKAGENVYWYVDEPRTLPDGRLTAAKDVDSHPKLLNRPVMRESLFVNRAVLEWVLGL
ncbi:hypothetical protein GF318_05040 [Candidatus Micrarchaeota archaeon]|nr:hypothetical protein [Candidatus Micrarchaeota archaeon]